MNIGPGSFCSRSLQKRPGGQYSPVWPLRSVNMSLVSLLTWSVPTQNFQRNRENDHCLTNKAFKIFEIWIGNGWFHMIGTQQQDHKTRLPFPSSVCYGPHPTSHVVFSLLSAFGLRSESFQQKCNTIACLQFDHVQYFKSTDRLALHLSVNLTRNTVKEDPSAPCAWIAYVHMPECCKCTLCMACILNTPRCFTRRSDIRDYSTIR